ncbi:MAG: D-aminoacyl-tRNA deacylase [Thermaurantimonas sp.]
MRIVIQRVKHAKVTVNKEVVGHIELGLLILVGVTHTDTEADADWLASKAVQLRIFNDLDGKMNLSLSDVRGSVLVVSQFTLYASTRKGNRPSYTASAEPQTAKRLYEYFVQKIEILTGSRVETGIFGAMMDVELVNDGPVTIFMDSKIRD